MFICLIKIRTFDHVIKYSNTLFRYDIISGIHLYHLSYVCELDPGAHMRCIRYLSKTGCDKNVVGGGGFQLKHKIDKYIKYKFLSTLLGWTERWFYIGNHK
jgi:hypothetical protein